MKLWLGLAALLAVAITGIADAILDWIAPQTPRATGRAILAIIAVGSWWFIHLSQSIEKLTADVRSLRDKIADHDRL